MCARSNVLGIDGAQGISEASKLVAYPCANFDRRSALYQPRLNALPGTLQAGCYASQGGLEVARRQEDKKKPCAQSGSAPVGRTSDETFKLWKACWRR